MSVGSRTRGTAAVVAIPAALMFAFGGIAAAADGGGDGSGSTDNPVTSVVGGVTSQVAQAPQVLAGTGGGSTTTAATPLADTPDPLTAGCKASVTTAIATAGVATPTDSQQQAIMTANTACDTVTSADGITDIVNALLDVLNPSGAGGTTPGTGTTTPGTGTTTPGTTTPGTTTPGGTTTTVPGASTATLSGLGTGTTANDVNCANVDQAVAQQILNSDPSDPNRLDADHDGKACETSPTATANTTSFPKGAVAAGDGSTGGAPVLGLLALLGMGGVVGAAGATKLWFRRVAGV